jgi:hypothetical protein
MIQLAIGYEFTRREPTYPLSSQKQLWTLLEALRRGERLSTIAALRYGCGACSQRMGDLRRLGWNIQSENVKNENGGFHAEYFLD